MLQLRLMERKGELKRRDEHEAMIDQMAGLVLTRIAVSRRSTAAQDAPPKAGAN
jgi:hypothetical protein